MNKLHSTKQSVISKTMNLVQ